MNLLKLMEGMFVGQVEDVENGIDLIEVAFLNKMKNVVSGSIPLNMPTLTTYKFIM